MVKLFPMTRIIKYIKNHFFNDKETEKVYNKRNLRVIFTFCFHFFKERQLLWIRKWMDSNLFLLMMK